MTFDHHRKLQTYALFDGVLFAKDEVPRVTYVVKIKPWVLGTLGEHT